jgi:1-acyl-sn-glycerol-3-phosphate acyltransferase
MITYIRSGIFYITVSLFSAFYFCFIFVPHAIFSKTYNNLYKSAIFYSFIFISLAKNICGLNYSLRGNELLPKEPYVVLANHQSFWENVFMQLVIPVHSWVVKRELYSIPFFGWGLKIMDPIAVDRSNMLSVAQILEQGAVKLKNNISVIIFPESTRLSPDQTKKYKPSGVKLAVTQNVPMVLIAHNAGLFWPKGSFKILSGKVDFEIIDVIYPNQYANLDVRTLTDLIEEKINKRKSELASLNSSIAAL